MAHRHVAERWAEQQRHGRTQRMEFSCGNISYREQTILSYHWWPIAHIVDVKGKVALLRAETYSMSTCKHQNHAWHALHYGGYKIIHVPVITHNNRQYGGPLEESDHMANLAWFEQRIGETLERADRARVYRDTCMAMADSLIEAMGDYIEYFNLA